MAELQGRLVINAEAKGFGQLKSEVGSIESTLGRFGSSAGLAAMGLGALTDITGGLVHGLKSIAGEYKQWAFLSKQFKGDIDAVEGAVRYLIDDLDLMRAQLRMSQAGFMVTGDQFKDLAVAAAKFAKAAGEDATQALQNLTEALVTGNARGVKHYGIIIDNERAESDYAKSLFSVREALDEEQKAQARRVAMLEKVNAKQAEMPELANNAATALREMKDAFEDVVRLGIKNFITEMERMAATGLELQRQPWFQHIFLGSYNVGGLVEQAKGQRKILEDMAAKQKSEERAAMDKTMASWRTEREGFIRGVMGKFEGSRKPGARAARRQRSEEELSAGRAASSALEEGLMGAMGGIKTGALLGGTKEGADIYEAQQKAADELERGMQKSRVHLQLMTMENQANVERTIATQRYAEALRQAQDPLGAMVAKMHGLTAAVQMSGQQWAVYETQYRAAMDDRLLRMGVDGLAGIAGGLWQAADAAIQGGESMSRAIAKMVKSTLLGIAAEATVHAAKEGALALGSLAMLDFRGAAMHGTAAAKWAGVAVMAGGAGLAMSAGLSGGGASANSQAAAEQRPLGSLAPSRNFGERRKEDERPLIVNLYLGSPNDPAAANIMRRQVTAQLAQMGQAA